MPADGVPMAIDRQVFFDVMASFPSGVAIVTTTGVEGAPRGLTTTAVCSVSAAPPTLLVCIDLGSRTLAALRERKGFVVNLIGGGRGELCRLFASKAVDKFAGVAWTRTPSGLPLLHEDAFAWAECATVDDVSAGDHAVLVARVDDGGVRDELEPPLLYYRRSWGVWAPGHEPGDPGAVEIPPIEVGARDLRWQGADT